MEPEQRAATTLGAEPGADRRGPCGRWTAAPATHTPKAAESSRPGVQIREQKARPGRRLEAGRIL